MHDIFPTTAQRIEQWKAQPEVLGVLLVGSKSREHDDRLSDDDLEILLDDHAFAAIAPCDCGEILLEGEGHHRRLIYDAQYTSLSDLQRKASSVSDLDHWPYERAGILFDRNGQVASAVQAAAAMSADFRHLRLQYATIDTWTSIGRAEKTLQRGFESASRLLTARGAKALARILFALEWRWVPLDHWLETELQTLADPTSAGPLLLEAIKINQPTLLADALESLNERLAAENIPTTHKGRHDLFFELIHPNRSAERMLHAL